MIFKKVILFIICVGVALMLFGCKKRGNTGIKEEPKGGKTVNTDYSAPKTIESDDIVLFKTEFYRNADVAYDTSRQYAFNMTMSESGAYVISEGYNETLKCETDASFAGKLQALIRKYDIIKMNGKYELTSTLPPEYGPFVLKAEYASGEKLNITVDGDPSDSFTGEVLDLFAKEFGNHGINDLLPPEENTIITSFSIEYTRGDKKYAYGEMLIPISEDDAQHSLNDVAKYGIVEDGYIKKAWAHLWDRTEKTEICEDRMADLSDEFYKGLQDIVENTDLKKLVNGKTFPGGFDYDNTPEYYEIHIEYKSGKTLSAFSDNPEECARFIPVAEQFAAYYEGYLSNGDVMK